MLRGNRKLLSYLPLVEITSSLRKILQEELGRERIHLNKNVIRH
jgi:hypothetical protein